jgi:fatty acid synthase subunit alpha, fungi type
LIEIGPSDTLTVMAKRTIKSQYAAKDATLSTKRQILSADSDLAEIYYEVDPEPPSGKDEDIPPPAYTASAPEQPRSPPKPSRTNGASQKKPDAPVSTLEIILTVMAQKLKKTSDEISVSSTIKSLVSGMPFPLPTPF